MQYVMIFEKLQGHEYGFTASFFEFLKVNCIFWLEPMLYYDILIHWMIGDDGFDKGVKRWM